MKTQGRPKSRNIEDRRTPFGSNSLNGMTWLSKVEAHYRTSIKDAASNKSSGSKFTKPARHQERKRGR